MIKYLVLCSEGVEERIRNVEEMMRQLPQLHIVMSNRENVFQNFVDGFKLEEEYEGLVFLEDDIVLCKDFYHKVEKLISEHKDEVVSMFELPCSKAKLSSSYKNGRQFNSTCCNYYPKSVCKLLADPKMMPLFKDYFFNKLKQVWNYPSDTYVAFVLGYHKVKYYMSLPFLVQHLPLKSNFKGRSTKRRTSYFIDEIEDDA